jgi:hypothetical protein
MSQIIGRFERFTATFDSDQTGSAYTGCVVPVIRVMERDTGSTFFVYKADVKHLILMLNELLTMEEYTLDDGVEP